MSENAIEVWRGGVSAWEADHMGHMNVRYYMKRMEWSLHYLYAEMGVDPHTVSVRTQHHRFHKEVHVGGAIHAMAEIVAMGESDATMSISLIHTREGALCGTFVFEVECTENWSDAARAVAAKCAGELDDLSRRRGLREGEGSDFDASREEAIRRGMHVSMRTIITAERCDSHGRLRLWETMALTADGMPYAHSGGWREVLKATAPTQPKRLGGALVEFAFYHHRLPVLGERVEMWSAPSSCTDKIIRSAHWVVDPATGEALATVRAVGVALDLDARKLVPLTDEARAAFQKEAAPGFE
jgi:acyl-CoA thioester hydrolase